ncbi:MAG: DNA mismatch repair protein MutS [Deltaproteobacteria bacterium]|nr:DNA mismatch repair protein MutS [Deltaproteobacteria bacterium]
MTDPRQSYERRLEERRQVHAREERTFARVGSLRGLCFVLFLAVGVAALSVEGVSGLWTLLPVGLFLTLVILHEGIDRRRLAALRATRHYERGLARLDDAWAGQGEAGERFAEGPHPFAADLDLFGEGSLFELLCTARTAPGEEALARWLKTPADPATARARQAAVRELAGNLDLREGLDGLGQEVRAGVEREHLEAWAARPPLAVSGALRLALPGLAGAVALAGLAAIFLSLSPWVFVALGALAVALRGRLEPRLRLVLGAVSRPGRELDLLARIIERLEREPFEAPFLKDLQARLQDEGQSASARIHQLRRLVDMAAARDNQAFVPFDLLLLWTPQVALAIEAWRRRHGPRLAEWLTATGELEAILSLSAYAFENPGDPFPELVEASEGPLYEGEALGHPLLPRKVCIPNDLHLDRARPLLMVSGSNMSGKTTYLRTVGINLVLARCGAPVRARSLKVSPLLPGGTLRIQDSLREGASRFYAELERLKALVDLCEGEGGLLFLLDEVLSGTNSHDRRIGAGHLLRGLLERGAVGLCTTHDLALTEIAETLPGATNVHFEDELVEGRLRFDYRRRPGVVERSNALALMEAVGLPVAGEAGPPD